MLTLLERMQERREKTGKEKMVAICDEGGGILRTIGPSGLRKPRDIAVDRNVPFKELKVGTAR